MIEPNNHIYSSYQCHTKDPLVVVGWIGTTSIMVPKHPDLEHHICTEQTNIN